MKVNSKGVIEASGNLEKFAEKAAKAQQKTTSLDDVFSKLNITSLSAVAGVTALVGAVHKLFDAFSQVTNMASHFEDVQTGLTTVLQSADRGKELFEDLRKLSFETTFGMDELASSATQFLNSGMKLKNVNKNLLMLGDLAQGDKMKFAELSSIYSKILSTGKAGAMQIQQFALRGVPLRDTLKEMGVVGVASAEDITKAFEKLTAEGGQFHNAMQNINDTITGKRGFITDTIKEILVNFGELSGITDFYKQILDSVKTILDKVNNKLIEWKDNPMMRNLIQGTIFTAIGGLVGIIVGSLIPALTAVGGLLSALDPTLLPRMLAGVGIGFAAGAGIGALVNYNFKKSLAAQEEALAYQMRNVNTELKTQYDLMRQGKFIEAYEEQIRVAEKKIEELKESLTPLELEDKEYRATTEGRLNAFLGERYGLGADTETANKIKKINEEIESLNKQITNAYENIKTIKYEKEMESLVDSIFGEVLATDKTEEIQEIQKQIDSLMEYRKYEKWQGVTQEDGSILFQMTGLSDDEKAKIDKDVAYLQNKLNELSGKKSWRMFFQEKTGIDMSGGKSGSTGATEYINKLKKDMEKEIQLALELNTDNKEEAEIRKQYEQKYANIIKGVVETLIGAEGLDEAFKITDGSIETLIKRIKELGGTAEETELKSIGESVSGNIKEKFSKASGDWQAFSEGMQMTGSATGGVIYALINSLGNILLEIDGIDKVLNPITNALRELIPLLEPLVEIVGDIMSIAEALVKVVIQWLDPVISVLNEFANWLTEFMGLNEELQSEKEKESELIKQMNEQMISLTQAMQEQEEYYYKMNKQIFNQAYADKAVSVNDMILTPNGTFSTNPQDTIIATKNPQSLGSTNVQNKIIVNNNANVEVEAEQKVDENGINQIFINISKKIAQDYADGRNGWELAKVLSTSNAVGRRVLG